MHSAMSEPARPARASIARALIEGVPTYVSCPLEGPAERLSAAPWAGGTPLGAVATPLGGAEAPLLCPVEPSKILGIGRNYVAHAKELGNATPTTPLVFIKPPSSLVGPGGQVELPPESARVDFEGELGVVIGKRGRRVAARDAMNHVFGLCVACDVTARDLQKSDKQWSRAKGFDTFCPVGDFVTPLSGSGLQPSPLWLKLWQNGELRQDGNTRDLVFDVPTLIEHVSQSMTLEPGDLILTGTPAGVGPMSPGDRIRVEVEGLGGLEFGVVVEGAGE